MDALGDLHNFGRAVRCLRTPDGSDYFLKPRLVFWEWLFFGNDSPLVSFFGDYSAPIFGLTIEMDGNSLTGRSKRISNIQNAIVTDAEFRSFGILLGYCYALGIHDLHKNNLIRTTTGLQVIDAEIVFNQSILPNETLLLPFKNMPFEMCGLSLLVKSFDELTLSQTTCILDGFTKSIEIIEKQSGALEQVFLDTIVNSTHTIRVMIRETAKYKNWESRSESSAFIREELEQLERGDVPYFFKFIDDPRMFYFIDSIGSAKEVKLSEVNQSRVIQYGCSPTFILNKDRLNKSILPTGILSLVRQLIPTETHFHFQNSNFEVGISENKIKLQTSNGNYEAHHRKS